MSQIRTKCLRGDRDDERASVRRNIYAMATEFYLPNYFAAEHETAAYIARLLQQPCKSIKASADGLSHKQPEAVAMACSNSLSILHGPPGTGKTTTLRCIVQSFQDAKLSILGISPTGKASKRMYEVINRDCSNKINCMTVHRGMKYNPGLHAFGINRFQPFDYDVLIMDEWSMLGCLLCRDFLSSVNPKRTRVLFCGDPWQLPSVDPGNVAKDMVMSGVLPSTELDFVFRTGKNSGIAYNAQRILQGENIVKIDPRTGETFNDCFFVPTKSEEETFQWIIDNVSEKIPRARHVNPNTDIQVLSPGKKGTVGTEAINKALRDKLNPYDSASKGKTFKGFRVNDRIINRKNSYQYGIVNGDVGLISAIEDEVVVCEFSVGAGIDGSGHVEIAKSDFESIYLAYCNTVHSSQGSEYNTVVVPIHRSHHMLLTRELVYTAWTRAKQLTVFVGDSRAFAYALSNNVTSKRNTNLQPILKKMLPQFNAG